MDSLMLCLNTTAVRVCVTDKYNDHKTTLFTCSSIMCVCTVSDLCVSFYHLSLFSGFLSLCLFCAGFCVYSLSVCVYFVCLYVISVYVFIFCVYSLCLCLFSLYFEFVLILCVCFLILSLFSVCFYSVFFCIPCV